MKTQKGFASIFTLLLVIIVVAAGIYLFQKKSLEQKEVVVQNEESVQPFDLEINSISESQIILSNNLTLSIDEFPDEVAVSAENTFGSSDKIKNAQLSPDDKWLAIAIGGAAHDFGWIYNLETKELNLIAFQYGGGVEVKEWISNSEVILKLETPEPKTIEKTINVNTMTQYPN